MAFTLNEVVPWGRSFDEYQAMFDLISLFCCAIIQKGNLFILSHFRGGDET